MSIPRVLFVSSYIVYIRSSHPPPRQYCPRKYLSRYPRISANILRDVVSATGTSADSRRWTRSIPPRLVRLLFSALPLPLAAVPRPSRPSRRRRSVDRPPPPPTTTVQYLYYPNRTLPGNADMIAIPFIYLRLYGRARLYTTLGTYQNRRPPCRGRERPDGAIIIFSDKPTIPSLSYPSRYVRCFVRPRPAGTRPRTPGRPSAAFRFPVATRNAHSAAN